MMYIDLMEQALKLAQRGRGRCAPNPAVGAVIVRDGVIVSTGWHRGAGQPHAEIEAIEHAKGDTKGAVMVVTLEPCNHWGKTPPCVDAIIASGIQKVVYGFKDPNPLVSANHTKEQLLKRGIDVCYQPHDAIRAFYRSYQHWMTHQRPFVTAKLAQTLDGKIAGQTRKPLAISNTACADITHRGRLQTDMMLTTAETVRSDNPRLNARYHGGCVAKPLAILDAKLDLTGKEQVFFEAKHILLFHHESLKPTRPLPKTEYVAVRGACPRLDLEAVFKHIGSTGCHDVWVEAGGQLFTALHEGGLVNRTLVYVSPECLGQSAVTGFSGSHWLEKKHALHWDIVEDNAVLTVDWLEDACLQDS